jgi:putative phosphoserine phosphatase/1-acylglycerol-3-phosphate O-acyltransferase
MLPPDLLDTIAAAPEGPGTLAFFDMDGTLVSGFTVYAFAQEKLRHPARSDLEVGSVAMRYQLGRAEFSELITASTAGLAGTPAEDLAAVAEKVYRNAVARWVYPESRALIADHRARGHRVVLLSAATDFQVRHVADDLGVDHVICNVVEVDDDGMLTGRVLEPLVFGEGKAAAAIAYAEAEGADLSNAFFYTDGHEDLPLLERVGHPQPLNPDRRLAKAAEDAGWNPITFDSRGRPRRSQIVRTILSHGSVIPSATAGLLTGLLNRSKRQAINLTMSTWADYATSLAGVRFDITGEENLWAHRPCVFAFNHQSNFDGLIMMKLLRKDITGVAKAELKHMPVVGALFSLGDVVFIDRTDTAKSVEALNHAADTLRSGLSIAIAPEGTRQLSPRLGEFKKGAFHLAIEAQVPVVPIVIHNSLDVLPKGSKVMRPAAVRIDVLDAVPTAGLTHDDAGMLTEEVRNDYLAALGQI